jgi:hypothetical protein
VSDETLLDLARTIAARFVVDGDPRDVTRHVAGLIHDSFIVSTGTRRWFLQRMNTRVFQEPERVMENIAAVSAHLTRVVQHEGLADAERRVLRAAPARTGGWLVRDDVGGCWRMFAYIEHALARASAAGAPDAESAARAFGAFQRRLADYDGPQLHLTIPRLHDTQRRYHALERALREDRPGRARAAAPEIAAAAARRDLAGTLTDAHARGEIPKRIAHNDAKIANVLFDETNGEALCVVDLDTVMPGLSLYDFGDLVRSMVSAAAEDEPDPRRVSADPARFAAIVRGYLDGAGDLLLDAERRLLPLAAETIVYEQGVRFLTDHLAGDTYYKTSRPGHNLDRCRAQFALLASLARQRADFERIVSAA